MKITGDPFCKHSYGDSENETNMLEVAACCVASQRLGIRFIIVEGFHATRIQLTESGKEELVLREAETVTEEEAREEILLW